MTGDVTQVDLPKGARSGLLHATEVLRDVKGIGIVTLGRPDIVRHALVQEIVEAYEAESERVKGKKE